MMFRTLVNKAKKILIDTEQIDEKFYAEVMDELINGFKDKGLLGKAIAQSNGNISKVDSIYIKLRARVLEEKFYTQNRIEKNNIINQQNIIINIIKKYEDGYFHELFRDEIKDKGFTRPWYAHKTRLFKNNIEYYTKLDTENMKFIIVSSEGNVIQDFSLLPKLIL